MFKKRRLVWLKKLWCPRPKKMPSVPNRSFLKVHDPPILLYRAVRFHVLQSVRCYIDDPG